MEIHEVHIHHARKIIWQYKGDQSFPAFLKSYFKQHKNAGSRDRRITGELCYNYFRRAIFCSTIPEAIPVNMDCSTNDGALQKFEGQWGNIHPSYFEKLASKASFWVRIPKAYDTLLPLLKEHTLHVLETGNSFAVELEADTKLEKLLEGHEGKYRVQDISSQHILEGISIENPEAKIWDCCAGSGGKSLLLLEKFPKAIHHASDVRHSIIDNMKERFKMERRNIPRNAVIDLGNEHAFLSFKENLPPKYFDIILADVPCSGSGTWRRTPESFSFFKPEEILRYAALQQNIVKHALPFLKTGGQFIYVTCSAFHEENENNIGNFQKELPLELESSTYFEESDVLFRAVFRKK